MKKKTVFVGFKYPHHGEHSGYDKIADYLPYDKVYHADKMPLMARLHRWGNRKKPVMLGKYTLFDPLQFFYRFFRFYTQCACYFIRNAVIHFAYPETGIVFSNTFFTSNRYIASLHIPSNNLSRLSKRILRRIDYMDHLITMSEDLRNTFLITSTTYIPHGVDTSYFRPDEKVKRDVDILFLGNWLRDFRLASEVFKALNFNGDQLNIKAVASRENLLPLYNIPGVECLSGIDDPTLLDLLQRTKILYLPLKDLTANNALLEAAACGCRICISLPPLVDISYFNKHITFLENDVQEAALALRKLLGEEWNPNEIANYANEFYSWEVIAQKTKRILLSISNR